MELTRGSVIGSYEVIESIGVGGMGDVYRARDSKLRREVALKILPAAVARDPDRIARFEREALALAALNHPHIAHIYGVEESQSTTALVLELVDGETLADRIARGPIPIAEAVSMAQSVADALDSAHAHRIVHRDLKPANVKITTAGVLKVLDFGLAKTLNDPVVPGGQVDAPTITSASTHIGVVLGTPAYMSPEQARGMPVDRRADVWAFGCLLFEMLAGSPAFTGSTSAILAAVLQGDPHWEKLPAATPPALVTLLRRCLEKDQQRRFHDIADVRIVLEDAAIEPSPAAESPRHRQKAWISAALLGAAAGAAILAAVQWRRSPPPAEPFAFEVTAPAGSEFPPNAEMALSPDGRQLLFVAASQQATDLWIHCFAFGTSRRLPDTRGATHPFWSADGRDVGVFAGGWLKRIDATGATKAVNFCEVGIGIARGGPGPRGARSSSQTWTDRCRIAAGTCSSSPLTRLDGSRGQVSHIRPQLLPSVLMQAPSDGSTEPEVLLEPGIWNWLNDWSRDGQFVVYAGDSKDTSADLWILPLTGDRTPWSFLKTPDPEGGAGFSPNGNWMAYVSVESGRPQVHVRAFPSGSKPRPVSTNGGLNPVWRKDGRELFFVRRISGSWRQRSAAIMGQR